MMLTEDEAKTKWCPFVRMPLVVAMAVEVVGQPIILTGNRFERGTLPNGARCIASDCMAWQWREKFEGFKKEEFPRDRWKGYCGLTGKP